MKTLRLLALLLGPACSDPLVLGSNVLWSSDHESGDLSDWLKDDAGGAYANEAGTAYAVVTDRAHSGRYAVKLTAPADGTDAGSGLFRHWFAPREAYYSAWYYLPKAHQTETYWTILQLRSSAPTDPLADVEGINLNLRSLPDGQIVLEVLQQRQAYLKLPLAAPTHFVPVGRWFQLEVRFLNATDETGQYKIWLDGNLTYDAAGRVTGQSEDLYFTPCNVTNTLTPAPVDIYVDDAMVSLSRATPEGNPTLE